MSKQLVKLRLNAATRQNYRCHYCNTVMCMDVGAIKDFAQSQKITTKQAKRLVCTAEHLIARQDGGKDNQENIVAACAFCNHTRHKRRQCADAERFKADVIRRLQKHKWNSAMQATC